MRKRTDFNDGTWKGLFHTVGAFLDECILRKTGGARRWSEEGQSGVIVLLTRDWSSPMTKLEKQFKDGSEDSILSFYDLTVDFVGAVSMTRCRRHAVGDGLGRHACPSNPAGDSARRLQVEGQGGAEERPAA